MDATLKWTIWLTPLESAPGFFGSKVLEMPPHTIVRPTGNHQIAGNPVYPWTEIEYLNENNQSRIGWAYDGYLEDYMTNFGDVVHVDPSVKTGLWYSPVQDINFNGMTQYNLSAGFCAAYIGGDAIVDFLKKCQANPASAFVVNNKSVNVQQLQQLLTAVYGYSASDIQLLADGLNDPIMGAQITSTRVSKMLQTHCLAALVHIDSSGQVVFYDSRKIRTADMALHWVIVIDVAPFGFNDGEVTLYNPYSNNMEKITFRLLYQSMAPTLTGLWIPGNKKISASDNRSL